MPMIEAYLTHIDGDETSIFRTYLRPVGNSRQPLNRADELDRKVRCPLLTGIRAICVKSQLQHPDFRVENYPKTFIYVSFQWTSSRKKRCAVLRTKTAERVSDLFCDAILFLLQSHAKNSAHPNILV